MAVALKYYIVPYLMERIALSQFIFIRPIVLCFLPELGCRVWEFKKKLSNKINSLLMEKSQVYSLLSPLNLLMDIP